MGIAFWDGQSRGTQHSFQLAGQMKKPLVVYDYIRKEKQYIAPVEENGLNLS
jgi:hypothetical protein